MGLLNKMKWIKNVKREDGTGWAYMENSDAEDFLLHFSASHAGGADKPAKGDIIVLFQTITDESIAPTGTYLTHLVLVDSEKAEETNRPKYPRGRHVTVLARTNPPHSLRSTEIFLSFGDVNTGQLCNFDLFNKEAESSDNKRRVVTLLNPFL